MWNNEFSCSVADLSRLTATAALLLVAAPVQADLPGWKDTPFLKEVVQDAARGQRHVLVLVGDGACDGCQQLRRTLRSVGSLGRYERVRYDARVGEGRDVARRYNVVAFPTLLVLGADAVERGRISGPIAPGELVRRLDAIRGGPATLEQLERRAAARPADLALALRLGSAWAARGARDPAERQLGRVIQGDGDNRRGLAAEALLALGDLLYRRSLGQHAAAERALSRLVRRYPRTPAAREARLGLALAMARQGRVGPGLALLERGPQDGDRHARIARFALECGVSRMLAPGLEHAREAVRLAPGRASLRELEARLLRRLGRHRAAQQAWQEAARLGR